MKVVVVVCILMLEIGYVHWSAKGSCFELKSDAEVLDG